MYRLILWPVLVPSFLFAVGGGAMLPITVLAMLQLGASEAFASASMAAIGAVALVVTVPVGAFIDRVGDKRAMALATTSSALLLGLNVFALAYPPRGRWACSSPPTWRASRPWWRGGSPARPWWPKRSPVSNEARP